MRFLTVIALAVLGLACLQGCKGSKPEPIPGPRSAASHHYRASGIVWFQGAFDEAFSRVARRSSNGSSGRESAAPRLGSG